MKDVYVVIHMDGIALKKRFAFSSSGPAVTKFKELEKEVTGGFLSLAMVEDLEKPNMTLFAASGKQTVCAFKCVVDG